MTPDSLNNHLSLLKDCYQDDIRNAFVDDFNSESASIIIIWNPDTPLKSLNAKIKRFFRYAFNQNIFPSEYARFDEGYYMFDFSYTYIEENKEYLVSFKNSEEKSYIKAFILNNKK